MATAKKEIIDDSLTIQAAEKDTGYKGPRVRIYLPKLEDSGEQGITVDQYEHVTIANEVKEDHYRILRGEWVEVPVPVFIVLKDRYPNL